MYQIGFHAGTHGALNNFSIYIKFFSYENLSIKVHIANKNNDMCTLIPKKHPL